MVTPSNAENYFTGVISQANAFGYLEGLPLIPERETEWLEFKGCVTVDRKTKTSVCISDSEVKSIWSEALSGFANTGGGLLVWGLDARKDEVTGIDCVQDKLVLHEDAEKLAERLKELLPHAVDPPVAGVQVRAICRPNKREGFVICYIPEGGAKPHRGESAGRNYYVRIGTSFVVPPVSLLRNLFFPNASVRLIPSIALYPLDDHRFAVHFALRNEGAISGYETFVLFDVPGGTVLPQDVKGVLHNHANRDRYTFELERPLHPKADAVLFANMITNVQVVPPKVSLHLSISCRDTAMKKWTCTFDRSDLASPVAFLPDSEDLG